MFYILKFSSSLGSFKFSQKYLDICGKAQRQTRTSTKRICIKWLHLHKYQRWFRLTKLLIEDFIFTGSANQSNVLREV